MEPEGDVTALSHAQLVALVGDLRRQLAARERDLARLKQPSAEKPAPDAEDRPRITGQKTQPGTPADLLAQLEKLYPEN